MIICMIITNDHAIILEGYKLNSNDCSHSFTSINLSVIEFQSFTLLSIIFMYEQSLNFII